MVIVAAPIGAGGFMKRTEYVEWSDRLLHTYAAASDVLNLRDRRTPRLKFRFRDGRQLGTWSVWVGGTWAKVADWPEVGCDVMVSRLAAGLATPVRTQPVGRMALVGDVLGWYLEQQQRSRALGSRRKSDIRSLMRLYLVPTLGDVRLLNLNKCLLHERLIFPMQEEHSVAYVRQTYCLLCAALRRAVRLGVLDSNPLAGLGFSEFGLARIKPKQTRLRVTQLPEVVRLLRESFVKQLKATMLAKLMLMTGTRVGETRRARWSDFKFSEGLWVIPASMTKTKVQHEVPLTPELVKVLQDYEAMCRRGNGVFLFPGVKGRALSADSATKLIAGLSGGEWSSHDLRKLARASWAWLRIDSMVCEALLNHAVPVLQATYVQMDLSALKREALLKWHEYLGSFGIFHATNQSDV